MTDTTILTERRGHLLIVTINRPEARNAVNAAVHTGIGTALEEAEDDPEIRVVIITGAGDKSFCAGADLIALSRGGSPSPDRTSGGEGKSGGGRGDISVARIRQT